MSFLQLKAVSKHYSAVRALEPIDLEVQKGEFLVLVGPSGCGKSTILRLIAGLEKLTTGFIYLDGKKINDLEPSDRDIAMVFQNYALYPHMKVRDNLAFSLKLRKYSKKDIKNRTEDTSKLLGIENLLERYPRELSGGERQRVAVGRAIVRHPKLFLFDEPLSNLDAKLRIQMRTEISRLHKKLGVTMIYVTHDQTEAMTMGDRIIVLASMREENMGGVIKQIGKPMELYYNPENSFVAGFIGSPAMNSIKNAVITDEGSIITDNIPGLVYGKIKKDIKGEVLIGFRPESIEINSNRKSLKMEIELVERMGSETIIHLKYKKLNLVGKDFSTHDFNIGDIVNIAVSSEKIFMFDISSGKVLT